MKVRIVKVHPNWNTVHPDEFNVGDVVELEKNIVTTQSGKQFNADDLTKAFSNRCSYSDIFEKV